MRTKALLFSKESEDYHRTYLLRGPMTAGLVNNIASLLLPYFRAYINEGVPSMRIGAAVWLIANDCFILNDVVKIIVSGRNSLKECITECCHFLAFCRSTVCFLRTY